jgi:hypothetical protein
MTELAPGAQRILEARRNGSAPADEVIVSLVGATPYTNPTIHYRPGCDWTVLAGLNVLVWCNSGSGVAGALADIAWYPKSIDLWAQDAKQGWRIWPDFSPRNWGDFVGELDALAGAPGAIQKHAAKWFPEWAHRARWRMVLRSHKLTEGDIFGERYTR